MRFALPQLTSILSARPGPRIVDFATSTATNVSPGGNATYNMPTRREAGLLAIAFLVADTFASSAPTLPTGWTNLTVSVAVPWFRVCYRFLVGSEASTFTASATTGGAVVNHFGIVLTIAGAISSKVPQIGTTAAITTGASPKTVTGVSLTATSPLGVGGLFLPFYLMNMGNDTYAVSQRPAGFTEPSIFHASNIGAGNDLGLFIFPFFTRLLTVTSPTATFTYTTSGGAGSANTVCVRGP